MRTPLLTALLLLSPIAMVACEEACANCEAKAEIKDITLADLKKAIADKKVTLLDANGTESFIKGRLPGAIDFVANKADLAKVLPADKASLIVAYCGGPKCGAWKGAATAAAALGYTNVQHFSGGLAGWKEAGEQLTVAAK